MKKVIALIMVCAMSIALFGCGKKDAGKGGETTKAAAQATEKAGGNAGGDAAAASKVKFAVQGEKLILYRFSVLFVARIRKNRKLIATQTVTISHASGNRL